MPFDEGQSDGKAGATLEGGAVLHSTRGAKVFTSAFLTA